MKKTVINATQGGAKIKGTKQMLLRDVLEKYCKETINKSKVKPLLTLASDGDELIEKVIPLLKKDIQNLDKIIKHSKKAMAVNHGMKTLLKRKKYKKLLNKKKELKYNQYFSNIQKETNNPTEQMISFYSWAIKSLRKCRLKTILILSYKNFISSENAHTFSQTNPLVNVAIFGAIRKIQGRDLKVDGTITNFLKNHSDALIRIQRNTLILDAAYNAAKSLKNSYKQTYKVLKEYNLTKDESLLINSDIEDINLDDAEEYFEAGNWAHPLIDAEKILNNSTYTSDNKIFSEANKTHYKALKMKNEAIKKARDSEKENSEKERNLLKYNEILERARKIGREDNDFKKALKMIQEAIEYMPDEIEGRWGLATAYHHSGDIDKSIIEYQKLVEDFADNTTFKFEYGQVLLTNDKVEEGLKVIAEVMQETEEYDNFFSYIGDIYSGLNMNKEAIYAYESYLDKFSFDYKIWFKLGKCFGIEKNKEKAIKAFNKVKEIKPNYKKSEIKRLLIQIGG